jgi:hypothetical protein
MSRAIAGTAVYTDLECLKKACERLNWTIQVHTPAQVSGKNKFVATLRSPGVYGSVRVKDDGSTVVDEDNYRADGSCRAFQELTANYALDYAKKQLGKTAKVTMTENKQKGTFRIEATMASVGSGDGDSKFAL